LKSDVAAVLARLAPGKWTRTLAYREARSLPYDAGAVAPNTPLVLDATVYIDQLKGELPAQVVALIASRIIYHAAPALAEIAITIGVLDPADPRTRRTLRPIVETLERVPRERIIAPDGDAWLEAAVLSGILARTQGIRREHRRKFLNDALLFLMALDAGCVLISRNAKDMDLLLRIKPNGRVLLYERASR